MPSATRPAWIWAAILAAPIPGPAIAGRAPDGDGLAIRVEAGRHDRRDTPVTLDLPLGALPNALRDRLADGPVGWSFREVGDGGHVGEPVIVQVDRAGEDSARLSLILRGETPAGASRTFRAGSVDEPQSGGPWSLGEPTTGVLELTHRGRPVFRYNMAPRSNPKYNEIMTRGAYIHPAFTPGGGLITGDFSPFHPHHRGFFLAYTKTRIGDLHPDFWNIQGGTGKVHFDHLESAHAGPVVAEFATHHRWEASGEVVMRERWDVRAYDIPGRPYWLWDLTATQQAADAPVELVPYRYGGMAYRGPEPFVKGPIDVLTDGGSGRKERDQKPARWVDLTGPVSEGSDHYAGAMIADHPDNPNHPTVARIHPTTLPFFCYVPAHDNAVTIGSDRPAVFRYRIVIHDGRPDGTLDGRIWDDFAEPPKAIRLDEHN